MAHWIAAVGVPHTDGVSIILHLVSCSFFSLCSHCIQAPLTHTQTHTQVNTRTHTHTRTHTNTVVVVFGVLLDLAYGHMALMTPKTFLWI